MKKCNIIAAIIFALALSLAVNVNAEENKIGAGYQGVFIGNFLQGVSARGWLNNVGLEGNIFQASVDIDGADTNLFLLTAKGMFAPIVRQNSKFYVGLEAGLGIIDTDDKDGNIAVFGPLFGVEYNFQGLPELGFNWDVGYKLNNFEYDNVDIDLSGVSVSFGVHYYF